MKEKNLLHFMMGLTLSISQWLFICIASTSAHYDENI